jgi:predicted ATP-grasp superfamily ATP-dependent carboligase
LALCQEIGEKTGDVPVLLPVGRATLLPLAQESTRRAFLPVCRFCLPTADMLDTLNDKRRVAALAKGLDIPVPEHFSYDGQGDADAFFATLPPVVVKPAFGEQFGLSASQRYAIAQTGAQARASWEHFYQLTGQPPIIQEYLSGSGYGCSVLAKDGAVFTHLCHKRLREYPVSGGPSACCVAIDEPRLADYARRLVKATLFTGVAMFEFKADHRGQPHLLEVNPRVWGSYPLTRAANSGFSLCWFQAAVGLSVRPRQAEYGRTMHFFPADLISGLSYLKHGQAGRGLGALRDFLCPWVKDGVWEWRDPKPGLRYYKSLLQKRGDHGV